MLRAGSAALAVTVAAAALTSCSPEGRSPAATVDTLPSGAIRVVNHRPSAWTSADSAWHFVLEREITVAEGSPGEIGQVQSVTLLDDGRVATLELSPARIRLYSSDGKWIRDIGREGDGPAEFRDGEMVATGSRFVVHDPSNSRLVLFDTVGTFLGIHRCNCTWYHDLLMLANGRVGVPGSDGDGRGAWQITDPATGEVSGSIPFPAGPPVAEAAQWHASRENEGRTLRLTRNIPNHPVFRWAVMPDGSLVYGMNDRYRLVFGTTESDTTLVVSAPAATRELTTAEREALYEAEIATVPAHWRDAIRAVGSVSDIPARVPPWASVTALPDGAILVRLARSDGLPFSADLISHEGILLGRMAVPDGLLGAGSWSLDGDTIRRIARSEDSDGLPVIRIWRLDRPTGSPR